MDAVFYWDMTYAEIMAAIKAYKKRKLDDAQTNAVIAYRQAELISSLIAKTFGSKHQVPSMLEAFPGFFTEDMMQPKQQNWQLMKARVEAYAAEKRKRGEK